MAACGSSVRLVYFPSCTTPTTWTRVPFHILKYRPTAFAGEPSTLRANVWLTTPTRGALLSSCQVKALPASNGACAAEKNSGDIWYVMGEAATFEGLRSVVSSVKAEALELPQPANGGQFAIPTAVTPGIDCNDSIMRFCIAGTASSLYPAISKSVSTSVTPCGSKPKLLCSERTNPRTATIDEVTSRAQIAICKLSSASRKVMRCRSFVSELDFTISYGSVCSTCLTGTAPNSMPLANASNTATA